MSPFFSANIKDCNSTAGMWARDVWKKCSNGWGLGEALRCLLLSPYRFYTERERLWQNCIMKSHQAVLKPHAWPICRIGVGTWFLGSVWHCEELQQRASTEHCCSKERVYLCSGRRGKKELRSKKEREVNKDISTIPSRGLRKGGMKSKATETK